MFKKIAVVLSIFFIFDRFIHYKLDQVITASKEMILVHQRESHKGDKSRKALVTQESKRRSTTRA